MVRKGAILRL